MIKDTFIKNDHWFIYNTLKGNTSPEFISVDLSEIKCIQAETDTCSLHIRFYTSYNIEENKTNYNWNITYDKNDEGQKKLKEDLDLLKEMYRQYILGERAINCKGEVIEKMAKIENK